MSGLLSATKQMIVFEKTIIAIGRLQTPNTSSPACLIRFSLSVFSQGRGRKKTRVLHKYLTFFHAPRDLGVIKRQVSNLHLATIQPTAKSYKHTHCKTMKPSRAALALMASTATAFTVTRSSSFLGRPAASAALRSQFASVGRGTTTTMLLNFFGGGAFESKIDYSQLEFPGPELAVAAEQDQVLVTSPSKPNLAVASFAGGCL